MSSGPPGVGSTDHHGWDGERYQQRFDRLAAAGVAVHGEADVVDGLAPPSVRDAGCGTGRVARELGRRGVDVVGVDPDRSMIETARQCSPELTWVVSGMEAVTLGRVFDVVVMAGNVPLFTPAGTRAGLVAGCGRHLTVGGSLVAGFQLGRDYSVEAYDDHCGAAGLVLAGRWSTWSSAPFTGGSEYQVSIHQPR